MASLLMPSFSARSAKVRSDIPLVAANSSAIKSLRRAVIPGSASPAAAIPADKVEPGLFIRLKKSIIFRPTSLSRRPPRPAIRSSYNALSFGSIGEPSTPAAKRAFCTSFTY